MKTIDFVAGYTINEAIEKAIKTAVKSNTIIHANINDIILIIDKNTNLKKAIEECHQKLNFKYEIEKLKHEIDKEHTR